MSRVLQVSLLIVSLLVLIAVIYNVIKNKMNIRYSLVWIVWGVGIVFISIFPNTIYYFSDLIGIAVASNTVFLIMIFFLYCLSFYVFFVISKHNEEIINLNYEISILRKKIEELEKE